MTNNLLISLFLLHCVFDFIFDAAPGALASSAVLLGVSTDSRAGMAIVLGFRFGRAGGAVLRLASDCVLVEWKACVRHSCREEERT